MNRQVGRPTKKTPDTVTKLKAAFNNGYNIVEACDYAGVAPKNFYAWLEKDENFRNEIEQAKRMLNRKAKENVAVAIQAGDANMSRYFLDRRDPEFKPKGEVDNNIGLQDTRNKIKDFLDDPSEHDDTGGEPATADTAEAGDEVAEPAADIS